MVKRNDMAAKAVLELHNGFTDKRFTNKTKEVAYLVQHQARPHPTSKVDSQPWLRKSRSGGLLNHPITQGRNLAPG